MELIQNIQTSATYYPADNTTRNIYPTNGVIFTPAELSKLIGGGCVYWTISDGNRIVSLEDKMMDTAPRNEPLYRRYGVPVVGPVVVCPAHIIPDFKH